ncbi:HK97 family phage prohead protease [Niallia sp. BSM11]
MKKEAFQKYLEQRDYFVLLENTMYFKLGSVREKTLFLEEDEIGVSFKLIRPNNRLGKRRFSETKRGILQHASFQFYSDSSYAKGKEKYRII